MGDQKYTRADVAERNGRKGAPVWIIIKDVVYDVTSYLNEHPGGDDVVREQAGKDATKEFDSVGHSTDATIILKKYRIGELVEPKKPVTVKSTAEGTLVAQKKLPSSTGPLPSQGALPPGPSSGLPATALCGSPATKAEPTSSSVARFTSTSLLSGTIEGSITESGSTLASVTPGVNVPTANISPIPSDSSVVRSATILSGTTSVPVIEKTGSTLATSVSTSTNPNVSITATSITSTTGPTTSDSKPTLGPTIETPTVSLLTVSATPAPNVPTSPIAVTSTTVANASASSSTSDAQASGMSGFPPTTATTVPTISAFNRPTPSAPKNASTEVPRNVADTSNVLPEPDKTAIKPTIKPLRQNNSSIAQLKSAAVNITPDSNKSKLESGTLSANGRKSALLGTSTKTTQYAPNGKLVSPSQSLNKSQDGISPSKSSILSKSSVTSVTSSKASSFSQGSKASSFSGKAAAQKSQLPWNNSKKPASSTTNGFISSSAFKSKPATYDPYKKDKGAFGGFSSFKKK